MAATSTPPPEAAPSPPLDASALAKCLAIARRLRLGLGTLQILALLEDGDTHALHVLTRKCGVSSAALTELAQRLVKLGFAVRENARGDRRKVYLSITPAGRTALRSILSAI